MRARPPQPRRGGDCALLAFVLFSAAELVPPALAVETTVQNDSFVSGGPAVIVGDFVPGEQAGVRLTSPCNGDIVAVQIGWLASNPGEPLSIERAIHIYNGATFPVPGPQLAILEAPVLTPGALNEFRYLDDQGSIPLRVAVTTGQQFYVTLEFDNPTHVGTGGASVFRDTNGCQSGRNVLFAIPGGWLNFCIFISGDLVIRAVIDCNPTGACCIPATMGCLNLSAANCATAMGIYQGNGTNCATTICFPMGACCLPNGSCLNNVSPATCSAQDGTFQGNGTTCASVNCPPPTGACCFGIAGCIPLSQPDCAVAAGNYRGDGTHCADLNGNGLPDVCEPAPCNPCDTNCDGSVNSLDVSGLVNALLTGSANPCSPCNSDTDNSGTLDGLDISGLVGCLLAP